MNRFNDRDFRHAMSQFCTGVVVVTGMSEGQPAGFSAQSFVSLSLAPPLIAISPARTSASWPRIRGGTHFGINILSADQLAVCAAFAKSGGDKFAQLRWSPSSAGVPVLDGVIGFVECTLEAEHEAGDHSLVIGRVTDFVIHSAERSPLLFFRGLYGAFEELPRATHAGS